MVIKKITGMEVRVNKILERKKEKEDYVFIVSSLRGFFSILENVLSPVDS